MEDVWDSDLVLESFSPFLTAWPTVCLALGCPFYSFFPPLCFSPSSLCYKEPTTSLITQHEYEAKSCHSLCHEIKSAANPVYQKLVHVNRRLLPRACHAHRGAGFGFSYHQSWPGLIYWMPLQCFVISQCTKGWCLGSGGNTLLFRAVQVKELGLVWN